MNEDNMKTDDDMETIEVTQEEFIKINKVFSGEMFYRKDKDKYLIRWYPEGLERIKQFIKKLK